MCGGQSSCCDVGVVLVRVCIQGRKGQLLKDSKLVLSEAKRLDVFDKGAMVVAEVVFNKDILKQIKAHKNLLLRVSLECLWIYCGNSMSV